VGLPDEVDVVCYFLSRRASDASSERFLAAVVPQLAYLCGIEPPATTRDEFLRLWRKAVEQAVRDRRQLLLAVDGLDEDLLPPGSPSVASLLPTLVGEHAHVLVTSRPYPELPVDVPDGPLKPPSIRVDLKPFEGAKRLAELARKEFYDLTHGVEAELAVNLLGLLTAAAAPLTVADLLALLSDDTGAPSATVRKVKLFVAERAARILEPVGPAGEARWQFAHSSLLEYAQDPNGDFARDTEELRDPGYRRRIHRWAQQWRDVGWTATADGRVPRYLLDEYPATLADDPSRLTALVSDVGWVDAAVQSTGVDRVLADLRSAAANPANSELAAMLAMVSGQAHHLRPPAPVAQPGYVLRQLWMQAAELREDDLASDLRARLRSQPNSGLIPMWTTRRASHAMSAELGRHDDSVRAVAGLPDGRVASGGSDRRVLVWDPSQPGTDPVELGHDSVRAVAVLPDGRVVSDGDDRRVLVWDASQPGTDPLELGRHGREVTAVAVLPDGRVVSGGGEFDGRVLVWDPSQPGTDPVELGRHDGRVHAVAVLADGRVVSGGRFGGVLVWDPSRPGSDPLELGHDSVIAVAVLPDGRVVSGGYDRRVLIWNATTQRQVAQMDCSVVGLAAVQASRSEASLVVVHEGHGFSLWSVERTTMSRAE
jgi:hypothetical protein